MAERKEQKIVVLLSLSPADRQKILTGIKIAGLFKKELCLAYNYSKREKNKLNECKQKLSDYTIPIHAQIPNIRVSTLLFSHRKSEIPEMLSDDHEGIFIVLTKNELPVYKSMLADTPLPILFIDEKSGNIPEFKNVVLPLDLRKENSDTALWASYFGRFNKAGIVVVAANDKGKDAKNQVAKNVVLTQKLFKKFNILHKVFKGKKSSFRNAFEALGLAKNSKADLLIILGSSVITPADYLLGLPEKKVIKNSDDIPVLFLNPRKDNYILCD